MYLKVFKRKLKFYSKLFSILIYCKNSIDGDSSSTVIFEFYSISPHFPKNEENHEQSYHENLDEGEKKPQLDLEGLWDLIMRIVLIFEDMALNQPSKKII
jgi:hypothetical protein